MATKAQIAAEAAKTEAVLNMIKSNPELLAAMLAAVQGDTSTSTKETKATSKPAEKKADKEEPKSREERIAENQKYLGKIVKLTNGKYKGQTAKVFFVSDKKWSMRGEYASGIDFVAPRDCEIVGDMSKQDYDRLVGQFKSEQQEMLYVDATVVGEGDKAIKLSHFGWNKRPFFLKEKEGKPAQFIKTGFTSKEGLDIFKVLTWKVRAELGIDSLTALQARQDMLKACCVKKPAELIKKADIKK